MAVGEEEEAVKHGKKVREKGISVREKSGNIIPDEGLAPRKKKGVGMSVFFFFS